MFGQTNQVACQIDRYTCLIAICLIPCVDNHRSISSCATCEPDCMPKHNATITDGGYLKKLHWFFFPSSVQKLPSEREFSCNYALWIWRGCGCGCWNLKVQSFDLSGWDLLCLRLYMGCAQELLVLHFGRQTTKAHLAVRPITAAWFPNHRSSPPSSTADL